MLNKKRSVATVFLSLVLVILFTSFSVNFVFASDDNSNLTNEERAFQCLAEALGPDCNGAKTVQELSLSILASVNVSSKCVENLLDKKVNGVCFGDSSCNIRDTSLAILALSHVQVNVTNYTSWLENQSKNSDGVEWILQLNSDDSTSCSLNYDGGEYKFEMKETKKLSGNFGPCFSQTHSNYWLKLENSCIDKEIDLNCDQIYSIHWGYWGDKQKPFNILADSVERSANNKVTLSLDSKCFGEGVGCNFEDTAWAAHALGKPKSYLPYLISSEDLNKKYFPEALIFLNLDNSLSYSSKIIQKQKSAGYWEAETSLYGKDYDTALALLSLGRQVQDQISKAKDWVWNNSQSTDGCWGSKNIRDSAFYLWVLSRKTGITYSPLGGDIIPALPNCEPSGFCSGRTSCEDLNGAEILTNFFCGGSSICCSKDPNPKESCLDLGGVICSTDQECKGSLYSNSIESGCCAASCGPKDAQVANLCSNVDGICRSSCGDDERSTSGGSCTNSLQCCVKKPKGDSRNSFLWVWLLIGIILMILVILFFFRDRIKVWYYKQKNKKGGGKGSEPNSPSGGFPGGRAGSLQEPNKGLGPRPPFRPLQPGPSQNKPNRERGDAFSRLKEMTK